MTNKEAIAVFKGFKFFPREQKAVDRAIKALEFIDENFPKTFDDYLKGEE